MEKSKFSLENFENKFLEVVRPLDILKKEGLRPVECLQEKEEGEISPENFIGMNSQALENSDCPNVLIMMPHSGEYAPKNLYDRLTPEGKKDAAKVDAGTVFIGQSEKIVSMWPKISRLCGFDLNRRPYTQDEFSHATESLSPGLFMWKKTRTGLPMYQGGKEPTNEEKAYFSEEYHDRYYRLLLETVNTLFVKNKNPQARILAIDLHSYPEPKSSNKEMIDAWKSFLTLEQLDDLYKNGPLFLLSDNEGMSCDPDIKEALAKSLENNITMCLTEEERSSLFINIPSRKVVDFEKPFSGAYNVEFADKQRKENFPHLNLIQIEMNESAYVDFHDGLDDAAYDTKKLEIMRRLLEKSILDIDPLLKADGNK